MYSVSLLQFTLVSIHDVYCKCSPVVTQRSHSVAAAFVYPIIPLVLSTNRMQMVIITVHLRIIRAKPLSTYLQYDQCKVPGQPNGNETCPD